MLGAASFRKFMRSKSENGYKIFLAVSRSKFVRKKALVLSVDNYDVKMFRVWTSKVFTCVIIFCTRFENAIPNNEVNLGTQRLIQLGESKNTTGEPFLLDYNDYVEVSSFKKYDDMHFDYLDLMSGIDVENETVSRVAINKCCKWHYYLDLKSFTCIPSNKNLTNQYLFVAKKKKIEPDLNYLFTESMPNCGSESVLSVTLSSKVSIGTAGVVIEGEGLFSKYCIDRSTENPSEVVLLICRDSNVFCRTRICFRKCCPLGHSYGISERKCHKSNEPFRPEFYNLSTLKRVDSVQPSHYGIYLGDACGVKGKYLLERNMGEISYLGMNGNLFAPSFEKQSFEENEFCVEFVKTKNFSRIESFLCFSKTGTHFENSQLQFFLLSLGFIISCMFLFLTFLVYLFSPKSQNLYGKTLMCYIASLFIAYLCLAVIELKSKEIDKIVCRNLGYSLLFSFLAAFFWLNVMSFDIWKTFRLDRSVEKSKADKGKIRFFWYSVYAWGFPSVLTGLCACANQTGSFPYKDIKPDIGEEHCWFSKKKKGIYVFFIAPISFVIALNIIFYVQTAWKIWKVKADVKKIERQKTNKFTANKDQFIINGKLFIVMGITWSLEIISYFAPHPIWYITDAANALHGVFIFAVFVLKKKVLQQVSQQVRAPLQRMRQLTNYNADDLSTRNNFQASKTERKSFSIKTSSVSKDNFRN